MQHKSVLKVIYGQDCLKKIQNCKLFIAGVGGIGCQLLKTLSKSGFKKYTILDLDFIEETNLNRQFLFRQSHIGKSKAEVGKQSILKIVPDAQVIAINGDLYSDQFDYKFYQQFDIMISALDSARAREHLSKMALFNNIPLVDAGTRGYSGQAKSHIRFITQCHNCEPVKAQQTAAPCTIRSRPQKPVHCAAYAKLFYDTFFGTDDQAALKQSLKYSAYISDRNKQYTDEQLKEFGIKLFTELFDKGISDTDDDGFKINIYRKLSYEEAIQSRQTLQNPPSTYNKHQNELQQESIYQEQKLWSLNYYANKFVQTCVKLFKRKFKGEAPANFEKDDDDCMLLSTCVMNLRTYNFIAPKAQKNKHKYLTFYQCKDLAGKVQPAIASTNSIAAALQTMQLVQLVQNNIKNMKYTFIRNPQKLVQNRFDDQFYNEKLKSTVSRNRNISCDFCSGRILYFNVECDIEERTFQEFVKYAQVNLFSFGRNLCQGSLNIIKTRESLKKGKTQENLQKKMNFNEEIITKNKTMLLQFQSIHNYTPVSVNIMIVHNKQVGSEQKFRIKNTKPRQELKKQLLEYFRQKHLDKYYKEVDSLAYRDL